MADFERYTTWDDVIAAAKRGDQMWYQAPLNSRPHYVAVTKIYKNGKLRIDPLSNQADAFTADAGHLARFRRRVG